MQVTLTADAEELLKQMERRAKVRADFFARSRMTWRLAELHLRLGNYKRAHPLYDAMVRKRNPNFRYGFADATTRTCADWHGWNFAWLKS